MRRIHGLGGRAFVAADKLPFTVEPLEDAGDGFNWRLRDRVKRFWCDDEAMLFEACPAGGVWAPVAPLAVHHLTGRVAFPRCLRGQQVRATGVCRPIAEAVVSVEWDLRVVVPIADATTFDDDARYEEVAGRTAVAALEQCTVDAVFSIDATSLLVHLPFREYVFAGVGVRVVSPDTSVVNVKFDEGRVCYVPY